MITIKRASLSQLTVLENLVANFVAHQRQFYGDELAPIDAKQLIKNDATHLIQQDGITIGFYTVDEKDDANLQHLYVVESYRGQGVASKVIRLLLAQHGKLHVSCHKSNKLAINFYSQFATDMVPFEGTVVATLQRR